MRRTIPLVLAPLLVLAACGGDDEEGGDSTTAATVSDGDAGSTVPAPDGTGPSATTAAPTPATAPASTAGGSAPSADGGAITVGSADFPESQLLAQIYGQALAEAGYDVSYQLGIGAREIYYGAIESGEIDLVPEYTNSLLSFVLRLEDPDAVPTATNVEEQLTELDAALPDSLAVLTPSTAEDKDVIVCTAEAAEEHGLATLSDLAANFDQITLGAPPEFETRSPFGLEGFTQLLDAPPVGEFVPLDVGGVADALIAGEIDCGNLFSTMSVITTEGFVTLEDDQRLVPAEAVLPLVRAEINSDQLSIALDRVNSALTTDVLKELMVKVEVEAAAPDVVAREWLASIE